MCDKARSFLAKNNVDYIEKDVEKDPGAAAELQQKAAKAGVRVTGVPVFEVGGQILPGFDQARLLKLLGRG